MHTEGLSAEAKDTTAAHHSTLKQVPSCACATCFYGEGEQVAKTFTVVVAYLRGGLSVVLHTCHYAVQAARP